MSRSCCARRSPTRPRYGSPVGSDRREVDRLLDRAEAARGSDDPRFRADVLGDLRSASFRQMLRGYDRDAVDRVVADLVRDLT